VLIDYGGNTNLKPETASVWSATFSAHPQAIKNLKASVTYFDVTYNNRIVQPVSGSALFKALSDPTYQDFVSYSPTFDMVNGLIAGSTKLYNYVGISGLNNVVAVVYDRYINVARQHVNGVDLTLDYQVPTGSSSSVSLSANGAWLWSQQQISANAPDIALAGTIFNPPRFKGRFNVSWANRNLTVATYVNHVGGLIDNRSTPVSIAPQTTFDGSLRYHFDQDHGPLHGINATLSAQNIFNAKPSYAAPSGGYTYYVNYDSTNFSPVGRFVSFTISKDW
jgi:outer membrane receptor protein involved in Fe transport